MRLAPFIFAALIASPAAAQSGFATRSACLQELRHALSAIDWAEHAVELETHRMSEAPPTVATEHVQAALDAIDQQARAMIDYADALMRLCETYE